MRDFSTDAVCTSYPPDGKSCRACRLLPVLRSSHVALHKYNNTISTDTYSQFSNLSTCCSVHVCSNRGGREFPKDNVIAISR